MSGYQKYTATEEEAMEMCASLQGKDPDLRIDYSYDKVGMNWVVHIRGANPLVPCVELRRYRPVLELLADNNQDIGLGFAYASTSNCVVRYKGSPARNKQLMDKVETLKILWDEFEAKIAGVLL